MTYQDTLGNLWTSGPPGSGLLGFSPPNAPLTSPAFTGNPTAPTQAALNNSTRLADTAYADLAVAVEASRALAAEALALPLTGGTLPTYRATPTVQNFATAATSFAVTAAAGIVAGDLILLWVATESATDVVSCPGFAYYADGGTSLGIPILARTANGTEGSTFTVTANASLPVAVVQAVIAGPCAIDVVGGLTSGAPTANPSAPSITVSGSNELVLWFGAAENVSQTGAAVATTIPSGFTSRVTGTAGTANLMDVLLCDNGSLGAGATGAVAATNATSNYWSAHMVAVRSTAPNNITVSPTGTNGASVAWYAMTLALRGVGGTGDLQQLSSANVAGTAPVISPASSYATSAGDALMVLVQSTTVLTIPTITDTSGNTYRLVSSVTFNGGACWAGTYLATSIIGLGTASTYTFTPVGAVSGSFTSSTLYRIPRCAALDMQVTNTGTGATWTGGTVIFPSVNNELVVTWVGNNANQGFANWNSPFTPSNFAGYNSSIDYQEGFAVYQAPSTLTGGLNVTGALNALGGLNIADTAGFGLTPAGTMSWGSGAAAADVTLARTGAGIFTLTGVLANAASGGSNTSAAAVALTPTFANGTGAQLSDTTRDYMVYILITTAGTATTVAIGPTSTPANTIHSSAIVTAGDIISLRLPAGWYVKWAGTSTTVTTTAISC
jgi:hypothetical protein